VGEIDKLKRRDKVILGRDVATKGMERNLCDSVVRKIKGTKGRHVAKDTGNQSTNVVVV
jgi:hypothetical protein